MHSRWVLSAAAGLCTLLAACSYSTPIRGDDNNAITYSIRLSVRMDDARPATEPKDQARDGEDAGKGDQNGQRPGPIAPESMIDAEISFVRGQDDQDLGMGEVINFGGTSFPGPATVESRFDLWTGSIGWRGRASAAAGRFGLFQIDGFGGLSMEWAKVEVSSGGLKDSDATTSVGLKVGVGLGWEPCRWARLYGEWAFFVGPWTTGEGTWTTFTEAGLVVKPAPSVGIFLGWRTCQYREERVGSDVEFDLRGPVTGIQFGF